jgi:hypothetical protein
VALPAAKFAEPKRPATHPQDWWFYLERDFGETVEVDAFSTAGHHVLVDYHPGGRASMPIGRNSEIEAERSRLLDNNTTRHVVALPQGTTLVEACQALAAAHADVPVGRFGVLALGSALSPADILELANETIRLHAETPVADDMTLCEGTTFRIGGWSDDAAWSAQPDCTDLDGLFAILDRLTLPDAVYSPA